MAYKIWVMPCPNGAYHVAHQQPRYQDADGRAYEKQQVVVERREAVDEALDERYGMLQRHGRKTACHAYEQAEQNDEITLSYFGDQPTTPLSASGWIRSIILGISLFWMNWSIVMLCAITIWLLPRPHSESAKITKVVTPCVSSPPKMPSLSALCLHDASLSALATTLHARFKILLKKQDHAPHDDDF